MTEAIITSATSLSDWKHTHTFQHTHTHTIPVCSGWRQLCSPLKTTSDGVYRRTWCLLARWRWMRNVPHPEFLQESLLVLLLCSLLELLFIHTHLHYLPWSGQVWSKLQPGKHLSRACWSLEIQQLLLLQCLHSPFNKEPNTLPVLMVLDTSSWS